MKNISEKFNKITFQFKVNGQQRFGSSALTRIGADFFVGNPVSEFPNQPRVLKLDPERLIENDVLTDTLDYKGVLVEVKSMQEF